MLNNERSCNDGKVVLSKRYKASDMESGKDASVLESRTVRARSNKCQPHRRERINSFSSSPNNRFITKSMESTKRERLKIRGINQELSEDDKRLKRLKGSGSRRCEYGRVVRGKLDSSANSHPDIEESIFKMGRSPVGEVSTSGMTNESDSGGEGGLEQFLGLPGQLVSYPSGSDAFREFCKVKGAIGGKWEREKKVRRITPEDVLEFYGVKNFKASGGSYFCASVTRRHFFDLNSACRVWNDNIIWVKGNSLQRDDEELLDLRFRSVKQSKCEVSVEGKESLLDEVVEEETKLELVLGELGLSRKKRVKSWSEKVAKAQSTRSMTGVDEGIRQTSGEEVRAKTPGSGSSAQLNLTTSKIDHKFLKRQITKALPAFGSTISGCSSCQGDLALYRRIGIRAEEGEERAGEKPGSSQDGCPKRSQAAEGRSCRGDWPGYSQEEVDAIKAGTYAKEEEGEAEVLGVIDGLDGVSPQRVLDNQGDDVKVPEGGSVKVEEKDSGIKKGLTDLAEATERAENLQRQVNAFAVKGKQADMAQYRIRALEQTEKLCQSDLNSCRINLELLRQKFIEKYGELRVARENLSVSEGAAEHLQTTLPAKDTKFQEMERREKVLEREIKAKELLLKRIEELLNDLPAREELNAELGVLRARVVELQAMNLAESAQYIAKFKEDAIYHDRDDADKNA
ncbi:hypothetical protein GIB67_026255 [Kingdonia uniflora]|uniref:Uncharacterized protein n=1 Tax=Kingdonia uniflora TaxID=39325 RepID=A0A7J7L9Y1_9MAGN|nr:hypothetical protein GIB67_026255 [Kingdonia uniflora]